MASDATPRFEGEPVVLGGTTYVVPPLALGAVKRLLPQLRAFVEADGSTMEGMFGMATEIIGAALRRNYPDLDANALDEIVDVKNMRPLLEAVLRQSGLVKAAASEEPEGNSAARTEATPAPSSI